MSSTNSVDARRVLPLNDNPIGSGPVVYVMAREQRVADNWALLYAAQSAHERGEALLVLFAVGPMFNHGTRRHNDWMVASLKEVEQNLQAVNIPFYIICGEWAEVVCKFVVTHQVGQVIFDFNPLEPVRSWRAAAAERIPVSVTMVDARNCIPCWFASQKTEFAAHTFRPKVHKLLPEFLTEYPTIPNGANNYTGPKPNHDWDTVASFRDISIDAPLPDWIVPGEAAAQEMLETFLDGRINEYEAKRNDPNESVLSNLSPYLRWGNISAQRVALAVEAKRGTRRDDKEAFLEELIVRRELTDNYVYYTEDYDTPKGAHEWAQKTLTEHRDDTREYVYTMEQFEQAKTHDPLWNAMQTQMVREGKMHGWCRMYWAKKILEWTNTPEYAIEVALTLNDRYELDGRDSNGVVGVMWSIAGVHDRAWTERPVFGKIRYMNYNGAKRKFDVDAYVERYTGTGALFDE